MRRGSSSVLTHVDVQCSQYPPSKAVLSLANGLGALASVRGHTQWTLFWAPALTNPLGCMSASTPAAPSTFVVVLKSGSVRHPALFVFRTVWAVQRSPMGFFLFLQTHVVGTLIGCSGSAGRSGWCRHLRPVSLRVQKRGMCFLFF